MKSFIPAGDLMQLVVYELVTCSLKTQATGVRFSPDSSFVSYFYLFSTMSVMAL
jgi:hypothetical protein